MQKINWSEIQKDEVGNGKEFKGLAGSFTSLFKMQGLGCNIVEVEAGHSAWPYHTHFGHEELFIIVEGSGEIRFNGERHPISAGDVIFVPPGKENARQIINSSDQVLKYFAISSRENPEICYYPDSNNYATFAWENGEQYIVHASNESNRIQYSEIN